jgi:hypothetical protein
MNLADKVTIPSNVMARPVGDELVILDLASGTYFGLDPVGARLWQLIGEGKTLFEACDVLLAEFEVGREQLQADIARLADELKASGLIST